MRNNFLSKLRGRFISPKGNPIHILYQPMIEKDGSIVLRKSGEENTDDVIESYRQSTELSVILSRFTAGDNTALNRYSGVYTDLTQAPKNYREALDSFIKAENAFNALPLDLKNKFGNDWRKWLSQAGSQDWLNAMSDVVKTSPMVYQDQETQETTKEEIKE